MRISDWSSDVCSSDLSGPCHPAGKPAPARGQHPHPDHGAAERSDLHGSRHRHDADSDEKGQQALPVLHLDGRDPEPGVRRPRQLCPAQCRDRSEEHTSELQSLMRISYAVFCLKKKKKKKAKKKKKNTMSTVTAQQIKIDSRLEVIQ